MLALEPSKGGGPLRRRKLASITDCAGALVSGVLFSAVHSNVPMDCPAVINEDERSQEQEPADSKCKSTPNSEFRGSESESLTSSQRWQRIEAQQREKEELKKKQKNQLMKKRLLSRRIAHSARKNLKEHPQRQETMNKLKMSLSPRHFDKSKTTCQMQKLGQSKYKSFSQMHTMGSTWRKA